MKTCDKKYLVIAGASKCGTTSIHHWLRNHSEIFLPKMKEIHFFSYEQLKRRTSGYGDDTIIKTLCNNFFNYKKLFSEAKDTQVCIDNSPSYFYYSNQSAHRIKEALPNSKVLIILRDPVEKIYSQYMHLVRDGRENLDFESALKMEDERFRAGYSDMWLYKRSGFYCQHIKNFYKIFGKNNVKVLFFEDMKHNAHSFINEILKFADVSTSYSFNDKVVFNASGAPKSKFISRYILGGPLYTFSKKFMPTGLGGRIKRFFQKLNTGEKILLSEQTKNKLRTEYLFDISELEELLSLEKGALVKKFKWDKN